MFSILFATDGHGTASGPRGEAVDRSFSPMAADDIKSVVAYVRSVPAIDFPTCRRPRRRLCPSRTGMAAAARAMRGKLAFEGAASAVTAKARSRRWRR
jgi:hypothetical protein